MKKERQVFFYFFILFLFLTLPVSKAQDQPPESTDAAVIDTRISEEASKELEEQLKPRKPVVEEEKPTPPPLPEAERKFFVRDIVVRGNTLIPAEEIDALVIPYENQELTLSKVRELSDKIQALYRSKGYITTLVYIPPQKLEEQTLVLEVVEGKMGNVHVEGNRWYSKRQIEKKWILKKGQIFEYKKVARSMRRIEENPDIDAQAILRPGEETGYTDVYLKVKDHFPLHAGFQYDNRGVDSTGEERYGFTLQHNNFLIPDSILLTGTVFGKDFGSFFTQYLVPVGDYGTKLIYSYSFSKVAPKKEFKALDIHGRSEIHSVTVRQPVYQGDRVTSNVYLGFDFKDSRTTFVGGTLRRERLRVIRTGFDVSEVDKWGATSLNQDFSFGIAGLGASKRHNPLSGRDGAHPDFFKYNGQLIRSLRMPLETQMNLRFAYQVASGKLYPQEQFYLGGAETVRGYPEGDYLADNGILANIEYFIPLFLIPADWQLPHSSTPLRKDIQIVGFFDEGFGGLYNSTQAEEENQRNLMGIGGGLRIRLSKYIYARVEWGHALVQEPLTESEHTRFHFRLQTEI